MGASTSRSMMMRKLGGYGAAIAVTPYLLIKVAWTFGILLPDARMGEPGWRVINATTALAALVGILLGLAFSRPLGRAPARLAGGAAGLGGHRTAGSDAAAGPGAGAGGRGQGPGGRRCPGLVVRAVVGDRVPGWGRGRPAAHRLGLRQGALARGGGWAARRRGCARGYPPVAATAGRHGRVGCLVLAITKL